MGNSPLWLVRICSSYEEVLLMRESATLNVRVTIVRYFLPTLQTGWKLKLK
jgi:hypothetical protein